MILIKIQLYNINQNQNKREGNKHSRLLSISLDEILLLNGKIKTTY